MFSIKYSKESLAQIKKIHNKKVLAKIEKIVLEISTNPYSPTHKFERLKNNLSGYCSKRLDQKNRIIYQVIDQKIIVIVVSILGHYEQKP